MTSRYDKWANLDWTFHSDKQLTEGEAKRAILMDIRAELRLIRQTLQCGRFLAMPGNIEKIVANTTKPVRKRNLK